MESESDSIADLEHFVPGYTAYCRQAEQEKLERAQRLKDYVLPNFPGDTQSNVRLFLLERLPKDLVGIVETYLANTFEILVKDSSQLNLKATFNPYLGITVLEFQTLHFDSSERVLPEEETFYLLSSTDESLCVIPE